MIYMRRIEFGRLGPDSLGLITSTFSDPADGSVFCFVISSRYNVEGGEFEKFGRPLNFLAEVPLVDETNDRNKAYGRGLRHPVHHGGIVADAVRKHSTQRFYRIIGSIKITH